METFECKEGGGSLLCAALGARSLSLQCSGDELSLRGRAPGTEGGVQERGGAAGTCHQCRMMVGMGVEKKRLTTLRLWSRSLKCAHTVAFQIHNFGGTTFGGENKSGLREWGPLLCADLTGSPFELV